MSIDIEIRSEVSFSPQRGVGVAEDMFITSRNSLFLSLAGAIIDLSLGKNVDDVVQ